MAGGLGTSNPQLQTPGQSLVLDVFVNGQLNALCVLGEYDACATQTLNLVVK